MDVIADYIKICEKAARTGGAVVLDWVDRFNVREKAPADLVTEADLASQQAIRKTILEAFPDHAVLGEERESTEPRHDRSELRWIADPLDGTTNFVHKVPHYSVSLALEHKGQLLVGAVYDPTRDECFTAATGRGAFLDNRPIHTSQVRQLSGALAAVGFPPGPAGRDSLDLAVFLEAMVHCQAIRRTGSSALNLCYLAAGRFDVYWSFSTKIWDVAAGVLAVQEAGGTVTSPDGSPFVLENAHFLAASTPPLHSDFLELVDRVRGTSA